ncbi:MAG: hypothetical protein ACN6RD_00540 [Stenotrophomonas maltophilia]
MPLLIALIFAGLAAFTRGRPFAGILNASPPAPHLPSSILVPA